MKKSTEYIMYLVAFIIVFFAMTCAWIFISGVFGYFLTGNMFPFTIMQNCVIGAMASLVVCISAAYMGDEE